MRLQTPILIASCAVLTMLTSCATVVSGTKQHITVNTNPVGAECNLYRKGEVIAHIASTPERVKVKRRAKDITVACVKNGYDFGQAVNKSTSNYWGAANLVSAGIVGVCVDMIDGAQSKYSKEITLNLSPLKAGAAQPSLPASLPADAAGK